MLGDLSKKYEVGKGGPQTVSTNKLDPGGTSYGSYQLSSNAGTLMAFLEATGYLPQFKGLEMNSKPFIAKWKQIAQLDSSFENKQWDFIRATHYVPLRQYATSLGMLDTYAINQVLWSMGVQHGHAKGIVLASGASKLTNEKEVIKALYNERVKYVKGLDMVVDLKKALISRYAREQKDALEMTNEV